MPSLIIWIAVQWEMLVLEVGTGTKGIETIEMPSNLLDRVTHFLYMEKVNFTMYILYCN